MINQLSFNFHYFKYAVCNSTRSSKLFLIVMRIEKELPGGDPEPLEQLEFPIELNPDEEGLTEA